MITTFSAKQKKMNFNNHSFETFHMNRLFYLFAKMVLSSSSTPFNFCCNSFKISAASASN